MSSNKIVANKNVGVPGDIYTKFDGEYGRKEIVIVNNTDRPGLAILNGDGTPVMIENVKVDKRTLMPDEDGILHTNLSMLKIDDNVFQLGYFYQTTTGQVWQKVGDEINIPKDQFLKNVEVGRYTWTDDKGEHINERAIHFEFNTPDGPKHVYLAVADILEDGIDGDAMYVGWKPVEPPFAGKINFDPSDPNYDSVHRAFVKTNTNLEKFDNALGFDTTGEHIHDYPTDSLPAADYPYITGTHNVMGALKNLDTAVVDLRNDATESATTLDEKIDAVSAAAKTMVENLDYTDTGVTGQFVYKVDEVDGKINVSRRVVDANDIKITAATVSSTAVKEEWKIVNQDGVQLGDTIKIYKDSAFVKAQIGHAGGSVNPTTGAITDGPSTADEALQIVYIDVNGIYTLVEINLGAFIVEQEFKDGLTVNSKKVYVITDGSSEKDVNNIPFLSVVPGGGVKISGINDQIVYRINQLDVADAAVDNQYVSQVSETDGKIAVARKELFNSFTGGGITSSNNTLTQANHTLSIGGKSVSAGSSSCNIINSLTATTTNTGGGLATTITVNGVTTTASLSSVNADTVDSCHAGNASGNVPISNGSLNSNLNADMIDGYHIVIGSAGSAANTIYFL